MEEKNRKIQNENPIAGSPSLTPKLNFFLSHVFYVICKKWRKQQRNSKLNKNNQSPDGQKLFFWSYERSIFLHFSNFWIFFCDIFHVFDFSMFFFFFFDIFCFFKKKKKVFLNMFVIFILNFFVIFRFFVMFWSFVLFFLFIFCFFFFVISVTFGHVLVIVWHFWSFLNIFWHFSEIHVFGTSIFWLRLVMF